MHTKTDDNFRLQIMQVEIHACCCPYFSRGAGCLSYALPFAVNRSNIIHKMLLPLQSEYFHNVLALINPYPH